MNAEQQQDKLENYIAGLINEFNAANIRIASLERLMREAQQVAHQFQEDNEHLRTELGRTKEEIHWLSHKDKSINVSVKPRKPEAFHGNRSEDVEGFLVTLERYLRLSGVPYEKWVDYAASFLRHQADKWFRVQLGTYGENSRFTLNYGVFKDEFLKQFKPMNTLLTARDRIIKLRQTGSATSYTHRFLELKLDIIDMSEAEAKDRYMRGLKPHVFQKVRVENPRTLNEVIRMAQQFDEAVYNCRQAVGRFNRNPDAMELDVMDDDEEDRKASSVESETADDSLSAMKYRKPNKKFQKKTFKQKPTSSRMMTYNEKVRCMEGGLCFKCKQPGHRIKDCPQWKSGKGSAQ